MKKAKMISAVMALAIVATQTMGVIPGITSKNNNVQLTAYAYTQNVPGKWIQEEKTGRWWYRHNDGSYTKNSWEMIGNKWYFFDANGWMKTGWLKDGSDTYYLNPSGAMHTGWKKIDGKWYYFNSNGSMHIGWKKIDGKWYYFNSNGVMLTGLHIIAGNKYYFGDDGALIENYYAPSYYTVTAKSGVNVRSSRSIASDSNIVGCAACGRDCIITNIIDGWGYTKQIKCTNGTKSGWIYMENMTKGWPCKVVASAVNLRQYPGTTASSNKILATVPKGTVVIAKSLKEVDDNVWIETSYNGKSGWMCFIYDGENLLEGVSDWGMGI